MLSTVGHVTNSDTQLSDLLLFLGSPLFPQITADAELPGFASSIPFDFHDCTSARNRVLAGPESGMKFKIAKQHRLDSLGSESQTGAACSAERTASARSALLKGFSKK